MDKLTRIEHLPNDVLKQITDWIPLDSVDMYCFKRAGKRTMDFVENHTPNKRRITTRFHITQDMESMEHVLPPLVSPDHIRNLKLGAIQTGNLKNLIYLHSKNAHLEAFYFLTAAEKGYLHIMKWLDLQNCPYDGAELFQCAVRNGNLKNLKWLRALEYPMGEYIIQDAACNNDIKLLEWLESEGVVLDEIAMSTAVSCGHLRLMEWLYWEKHVFRLCPFMFVQATFSDNLQILEWLYKMKCPWDESVLEYVLEQEHEYTNVEAVKWLVAKGCPMMKGVITQGHIEQNNLELLKFLYEKGWTWTEGAFDLALENNNLDMLKWMKSIGCLWSDTTFVTAIVCDCGVETLDWLRKEECPRNDEELVEEAEAHGNLEVIAWTEIHCRKSQIE